MAADPPTPPPDSSEKRSAPGFPRWLALVCRALIVLALPPFLVLTGVRLVMSETFLRLEYNRPGFPPDRYGFTQAERLEYAPFAVRYLLQNEDELPCAAGASERAAVHRGERHMQDVQDVTRVAFRVHWATVVVLPAAALALAWRPETRPRCARGAVRRRADDR